MVITGSGGIATNDYLVLKQDRIESFIYSETEGNIRYKEVRRTESGIATNGQQVTMALEYRPSGGSWISGGSSTVSINQFNTHGLQVHKSLSTGNYDLAVVMTAADRSGTFTSGAVEYEYTTFTRPHSSITLTDSQVTTTGQSQEIKFSLPNMPGWELTKVVYTARVKAQGKARSGYYKVWEGFTPKWYLRLGFSELQYRNGSGTSTFRVDSSAGAYSPDWASLTCSITTSSTSSIWATTPRYRIHSFRAGWGKPAATIRPMRICNRQSTNGICEGWE